MNKRSRSMSKKSSSKIRSKSRDKKRVRETDKVVRFYHSAHGSLSTKKLVNRTGYSETHFVTGEHSESQVFPIKVEKDVSGVKGTVYFKINSDMCTYTLTGDSSKIETEGEPLDNLNKFHTLFTIEIEGNGKEFIIKKVSVHSPSTVDDMTTEEHVIKKTKHELITYKHSEIPPEIFYDGTMKTKNIPNLEFFYEATFNTGICGIDSDDLTQRIDTKLWYKTDMMKLNKIESNPGLETFPINKEDNSCGSTPPPCSPQQSVTLQDMFKEMDKLDEYDRILDEYYVTPETWKKDDNECLIDSIKFELSEYLEEASKIFFHHPEPSKSLLSTVLSKATFRSNPGDRLSVSIYNSTCLVNQKTLVGDKEIYTENPIEDRINYPDFYRLYEGPMDRSILLNIEELSSENTEAVRVIEVKLKMIKMRETWIQEDEKSLKKAKGDNQFDTVFQKEICKKYEDNITKFKKEIKQKQDEIDKLVTMIKVRVTKVNIAKQHLHSRKVTDQLGPMVTGKRDRGKLKKKKGRRKKKKGSRKYTRRK